MALMPKSLRHLLVASSLVLAGLLTPYVGVVVLHAAMTDNLVASWELDEASGDAIDAHNTSCGGSGCDLTDSNTVGASGGWRDFEADNTEYFEHTDHADLRMGDFDFTMEAWVNMESKAGSGNINTIIEKGADYFLFYDADILVTDRFAFRIYDGTTFTTVAANNLGSPSTATEYQIVVQYDATADEVSIKVNDGTANTASHANGAQAGTDVFRLGLTSANSFPFDGLMRYVRIWERKLTGTEITCLYNSGSGVAYASLSTCDGGAAPTTRNRLLLGVGQ